MPDVHGVYTLRDVLQRAADLYADEPAVICGERRFSHAELVDRTFRVAAWLTAEGVKRGDRVLVLCDNRIEIAEIAYAIAALGAVMVPLSPIVAAPEIQAIRADAQARLGIHAPGLDALARDAGGCWLPIADHADAPADEPPFVERPSDAVLQFYTSGTTGRPKGVVMTQAALVINGLNSVLSQGLTHDDVFLTCTPVTHAAGGTRIFTLGTEGIPHVILPKWSPAAFYEAVAHHHVTSSVLVPSMLRDLVWDEGLGEADLTSLRLIVYGAAPTPPDIQLAALERIPAGFLHSYGISEGCPALTVLTPAEHEEALTDPAARERLRSVGRPVPGVRFRITGTDGERLAPREIGEIHIRNAKVMDGYWHRPDEEAAIWQDGWMASGDLGWVDEQGYLFIVGRKKEMIISGGLNVYPAEIERCLVAHPAVREAAVVGVPHERWGETPAAFVVLSAPVDDDALRDHCRAHLARYKLPSSFTRLEAFPRNETGKVVKALLVATPAPSRTS